MIGTIRDSSAVKQVATLSFEGQSIRKQAGADSFQFVAKGVVKQQLRFGFRRPDPEYSLYRRHSLRTGNQVLNYFKKYQFFLPKLSMEGLSTSFFNEDGLHRRSFWVGSGLVIEKTGEITQGQSLAGMAYYLALAKLLLDDFGYDNITWTIGDADAKKVRPESEHAKIDHAAWEQLKMLQNAVDRFGHHDRFRFLLSSELLKLHKNLRFKPNYTSPNRPGAWHQQILTILEEEGAELFKLPAIQKMEDGEKKQQALADAKKKMEYVAMQIDDMVFSVQAEGAEGRLGWSANDKLEVTPGNWDERTFNKLYQTVCHHLREKYKVKIPNNYSFMYAKAETFPGKANACPYSVSKKDIGSRILMTDSEDEIRKKLTDYIDVANSTKRSKITGADRRTKEAREAINTLQFLQNTIWVFNHAFRAETVPLHPEEMKLVYFDAAEGNKLIVNEEGILTALLDIQQIFMTPTPSFLFLKKPAKPWSQEPDYSFSRRIHDGILINPISFIRGAEWKTNDNPQKDLRYFGDLTWESRRLPKLDIPKAILEQGERYDVLLRSLEGSNDPVHRDNVEFSIMNSCADYVKALHYTAKQEVLLELKEKRLLKAYQFFTLPEKEAGLYLEGLRFHRLLQAWDDLPPDAEGWGKSKDGIQDQMIETCPNYIKSLSSKRRERQIKIQALEKKGMTRVLAFCHQQTMPSNDVERQITSFYELIGRWDQSNHGTRYRSLIEAQLLEQCPNFVSSLPQGPQRKVFNILHRRGMDAVFSAYRLQTADPKALGNPGRYVHSLMDFWQVFTDLKGEAPNAFTETVRENIETLMIRQCFPYFASLPESGRLNVLGRMQAQGMYRVYSFYASQFQAKAVI
jgi:hypothetical protein